MIYKYSPKLKDNFEKIKPILDKYFKVAPESLTIKEIYNNYFGPETFEDISKL